MSNICFYLQYQNIFIFGEEQNRWEEGAEVFKQGM